MDVEKKRNAEVDGREFDIEIWDTVCMLLDDANCRWGFGWMKPASGPYSHPMTP